jgi:hypothetical protein
MPRHDASSRRLAPPAVAGPPRPPGEDRMSGRRRIATEASRSSTAPPRPTGPAATIILRPSCKCRASGRSGQGASPPIRRAGWRLCLVSLVVLRRLKKVGIRWTCRARYCVPLLDLRPQAPNSSMPCFWDRRSSGQCPPSVLVPLVGWAPPTISSAHPAKRRKPAPRIASHSASFSSPSMTSPTSCRRVGE